MKSRLGACLSIWTLAAVLITAVPLAFAKEEPGPVDVVRPAAMEAVRLINKKADGEPLTYEAVKQSVQQVVDRCMDFHEMARLILARHWDEVDTDKRERFVEYLRGMFTLFYIAHLNIDGRLGNDDLQLKEGITDDRYAEVDVRFLPNDPNRTETATFRLKRNDSGWMVFDVVVGNSSYAYGMRRQVRSVLDKRTFDDLLAVMSRKLDR